jgi:hypothetical protein
MRTCDEIGKGAFMKTYIGSCHCGSVQFQVESNLADPVRCNCSFCIRRGAVLQKVPDKRFGVIKGDEKLSRYGAREFSDHFFCRNCGIHTFTRSTRNNEHAVVVSLACLAGVDLDTIVPRTFDGAKLL